MAKKVGGRQSIIGAVGGVLIGAAILLFVCTMILQSLKSSAGPSDGGATDATRAEWNATNATIDQLNTFLTVCCILLGVLGIVIIGSSIIGSISGGFG